MPAACNLKHPLQVSTRGVRWRRPLAANWRRPPASNQSINHCHRRSSPQTPRRRVQLANPSLADPSRPTCRLPDHDKPHHAEPRAHDCLARENQIKNRRSLRHPPSHIGRRCSADTSLPRAPKAQRGPRRRAKSNEPYSRQSCIGRVPAQLLFWPAEAARSRPPPAPTRPKGKCSSCRRPLPCRPIACASLVPMAAPPAPLRNTGRLRMVAGFAAPASLARSPSHKDRAELPLSRRRPVQARRRREFAHTQLELIERSF